LISTELTGKTEEKGIDGRWEERMERERREEEGGEGKTGYGAELL
jgi:hypothetical protein